MRKPSIKRYATRQVRREFYKSVDQYKKNNPEGYEKFNTGCLIAIMIILFVLMLFNAGN